MGGSQSYPSPITLISRYRTKVRYGSVDPVEYSQRLLGGSSAETGLAEG